MNNDILETGDVVYYVVRANGVNLTKPFASKLLAESEMVNLSPELKMVAEVVPVTSTGDQLLFG